MPLCHTILPELRRQGLASERVLFQPAQAQFFPSLKIIRRDDSGFASVLKMQAQDGTIVTFFDSHLVG